MSKKKPSDGSRSTISSMTGYGVALVESTAVSIEVEIRSSNGRYLDLQLRLPRMYGEFEATVRERVAAQLNRGRVEVVVTRSSKGAGSVKVDLNEAALSQLAKLYRTIGARLQVPRAVVNDCIFRDGLSRREILSVSESPVQLRNERALLSAALDAALRALSTMRQREGRALSSDIRKRLAVISGIGERMSEIAARRAVGIRDRLTESIQRLSPEVTLDPSRLALEVAVLVERADISEELVRLRSHLAQFSGAMKGSPVGKKLDFIIQEIVRELNTIGSKAQESTVQGLVVDAKTEVERIREQVQNVE